MERYTGTVRCEHCDSCLPVEDGRDSVACDCGNRFIVTITEIPARLA